MPSAPFLLRLLAPLPAAGRPRHIALALFALGAALACAVLVPVGGWLSLAAAVAGLTALAVRASGAPGGGRTAARALLVLAHLGWLALAAATAAVLAWVVAPWLWLLIGGLAVAAVAGAVRARPGLRLPLAIPLGLAVAAPLIGWGREDGVIRCDDYLRLRDSAVTMVVPSTPELAHCQPGEALMVSRYPRRFWTADGRRFLVTTQRGIEGFMQSGRVVPDWFDGAVCDVDADSPSPPSCVFNGKAHDIAESTLRDRLYVAAHDHREGRVFALPRQPPFRPLADVAVPVKAGVIYLDDQRDVLGVFDDEGRQLFQMHPSDLSPLGAVPAPFLPDKAEYDQATHRGLACAGAGPLLRTDGQAIASVAFDGAPFSYRPLAPSSQYPSTWLSLIWGCAWDPPSGRVFVGIASLGLVAELDYDSGRILRRTFIGFGARSLALDLPRRRLYASYFLSGDVVALDLDSGAVVDRWFAGRFVRSVALSPDRQALFVTSNLGIVKIPL